MLFQSYLVFILLFLVWRRYFFKGHKVSIYWMSFSLSFPKPHLYLSSFMLHSYFLLLSCFRGMFVCFHTNLSTVLSLCCDNRGWASLCLRRTAYFVSSLKPLLTQIQDFLVLERHNLYLLLSCFRGMFVWIFSIGLLSSSLGISCGVPAICLEI